MKNIIIITLLTIIQCFIFGKLYSQCTPSTCCSGQGITRVQFNTIDKSSTANNYVSDFTSTSTTVDVGSAYNMTITADGYGSYSDTYVRVWIDWNNDGSFNTTTGSPSGSGEQYTLGTASGSPTTTSNSPLSITVPSSAVTGSVRMRVSAAYGGYTTACATSADAEFEDYTININAGPSLSYSSATFCSGDSDPSPTLTNNVGAGTYSSSAGLSINSSTGVIDLSASTAGTYTITYTDTDTQTATFDVTISSDTYYVSTSGSDSNNGLTSGTAFATLQKAIDMVGSGCASTTINVAAGTYNENGVLISNKSNINIVGAGISSTIFSGGHTNRFMGITGTSDNISISNMQIYQMDEGTVNGTYSGGGMYISCSGTVNLTSLHFEGCRCSVNGGSGGGGAIYVGSSASVNIYKSLFESNKNSRTHSSQDGGAICNTGTIHIENSLFYNNAHETSNGYDGVIVFKGGGDGTIVNSTITKNFNNTNGRIPIYVDGSGSTVTILNSILYGYPGGYDIKKNSTPTIKSINCIGYTGNVWDGTETNCYTTTDFGFSDLGSYDFSLASSSYCKDKGTSSISSPVSLTAPSDDFAGTTRSGNPDVGCYEDSSPSITATASFGSFSACSGTNSSEQSFTVSGTNLTNNIILTPPTGYEISETSGSGFTSSITITQSGGTVGSTTIYVRTTTSASNGDGGNIVCSSTGATTVNVATGSLTLTSNIYYVATTGSDSNSGLTSGSPFATIQHAIDVLNTSCGDAIIYIANGTYDQSNIDIDLSVTIIGESESGTIIDNNDVSGEYCFQVTTDNADVKLQNLTIRDFKGDAGCAFKSYQHDNKVVFDGVTVNSCYVNSGSTYDGVVFIYHDTGATSNDSIVIKNSTFSDNTSAEASGGCALDIGSYSYDYDYSILLENTIFDNNDVTTSGSSYGACMIDRGYSVTVKKCTFSNNNNYYYGSGLYVSYLGSSSGVASRFTLENCLFHDNSASNGGSCTVYNVRGSVFNSTFAQNTSSNASDYYVTGLEVDGVVTAKNCIFQSDDSGNEVIQGYSGDLTISYSLLYGGSGGDSYTDGGNNLSSDPDFTNAGSNDFTLASTSPCIDAGTSTGAPSDDLAGTTRDATPDLGCYEALSNEWTGAVSTAWTTTGNWSLGTVPTSSDAITIPDVTNQPIITSVVTLAGLTIDSGADITVSSNSLTVTGTLDLNGTMYIDNATVNADGTFDATGGTIDFTNAAGKLVLSSTVTALGTLDEAMGTIEYDGATQSILGDIYNNLTISSAGTKTAAGVITVNGDLTTAATATCKLDMGANNLNLAGDLTVDATDGLDLSDASCTLTFNGSSDQAVNHAGNSGGTSTSTLSDEDFNAASLGALSTTSGSSIYTPNSSSCSEDQWAFVSAGSANVTCSSCSGNRVEIWYTSCAQSEYAFSEEFTPTTSSIHVSFNYAWDDGQYIGATSYYRIYLYNSTTSSNVATLVSLDEGDGDVTNGAYSATHSVTAGNSYRIRFYYVGNDDWGAAFDNVTITESVTSAAYHVNNLTVNNNANILLNDEIIIDGTLTFTSGDIDATSNNLVLTTDASVSGASDASHVIGSVAKTTTSISQFTFPVGDGTNYRPIAVTPTNTSATTWRAKYNNTQYSSLDVDLSLDHVSSLEYWDLDRIAGTESAAITLFWDANSGDVITHTDLVVAHFDGTNWENAGGNSHTGNNTAGTVVSNAAWDTYSPFTIGTTNPGNALPVIMTDFNGSCQTEYVHVFWQTASEMNCSRFDLERSKDGFQWEVLGSIQGNGNSTSIKSYDWLDYTSRLDVRQKPVYYRLRQVDFDGNEDLFSPISVFCDEKPETKIELYPNPTRGFTTLFVNNEKNKDETAHLILSDITGKLLFQQSINLSKGGIELNLDLTDYQNGVYNITIVSSTNERINQRLIKQ